MNSELSEAVVLVLKEVSREKSREQETDRAREMNSEMR